MVGSNPVVRRGRDALGRVRWQTGLGGSEGVVGGGRTLVQRVEDRRGTLKRIDRR